MNASRRKELKDVGGRLDCVRDLLVDIQIEEDMARDACPENFQGNDQYRVSEEASEKIGKVIKQVSNAIDIIEELTS